jgi:ubiquinone/menaquinone biosynthesis C-methylase UbiE
MSQRQAVKQHFHFKGFSNLDASEDANFLVNSMDIMYSLESIKIIKKRALESMCLSPGDRILEVGCGHGEDAEALGLIVGNTGSVLAIDISQRMIEEAKKRSKQMNVEYLKDDARNLPYLDHTFSACHADRLLVSSENYRELFQEVVRLVRPGGIICFTDVDALSIILAPFNPATNAILDQIHKSFVNPYMGRILPELFTEQGLTEVRILPEVAMIRSFETLSEIFQFSRIAETAINEGTLTREIAAEWFRSMYQGEKEKTFLYCITFFTVVGKVPPSFS